MIDALFRTDSSDNEYTDVLKGRTLQIYCRLLRSKRSWSARELQRNLGFSSPSLSLYHLDKLVKASLVKIDNVGMYRVSKVVRAGVLRYFFRIGNQLVPRYFFYAVFFITILISSIISLNLTFHPVDLTFVIMLIIAILIFIYETIWLLRKGFQ